MHQRGKSQWSCALMILGPTSEVTTNAGFTGTLPAFTVSCSPANVSGLRKRPGFSLHSSNRVYFTATKCLLKRGAFTLCLAGTNSAAGAGSVQCQQWLECREKPNERRRYQCCSFAPNECEQHMARGFDLDDAKCLSLASFSH